MYYDYDLLSKEAKKLLSEGFCINDNDTKVWFGIESVIEYYLELGTDKLKGIPKQWWKKLNLNTELQEQIEKHFKENSDNIVIFCYPGDEL
jgi:hypothetical protein